MSPAVVLHSVVLHFLTRFLLAEEIKLLVQRCTQAYERRVRRFAKHIVNSYLSTGWDKISKGSEVQKRYETAWYTYEKKVGNHPRTAAIWNSAVWHSEKVKDIDGSTSPSSHDTVHWMWSSLDAWMGQRQAQLMVKQAECEALAKEVESMRTRVQEAETRCQFAADELAAAQQTANERQVELEQRSAELSAAKQDAEQKRQSLTAVEDSISW